MFEAVAFELGEHLASKTSLFEHHLQELHDAA
jgi:hypothetical protein